MKLKKYLKNSDKINSSSEIMEYLPKEEKKSFDDSKLIESALKQFESQVNDISLVLNTRLEEISIFS